MCLHEYKNPKRKGDTCPYDDYGQASYPYGNPKNSFCVFHDPSENKDPERFWKMFDALINHNLNENIPEWDFEGFVFPKMDFRLVNQYDIPVNVKIVFDNSIFFGADFRGFRFPEIVSFIKCDFLGQTHFGRADFARWVSFGYSKFDGWASFEETKFRGDAVFFKAEFEDSALFYRSEFNIKQGNMDFIKAEFRKDVHFDGSKFYKKAEFMEAIFNGEATFTSTQFFDLLNLYGARFLSNAVFSNFECYVNSDFENTIFDGRALFVNSYFLGRVIFRKCIFNSITDFSRATFYDLCFTGSVFNVQPLLDPLYPGSEKIHLSDLSCNSTISFAGGYDPRLENRRNLTTKEKNPDIELDESKPFVLFLSNCTFSGLNISYCRVSFIDLHRSNINGYSYISPKYQNNPDISFDNVVLSGDFIIENSRIKHILNSYINNKLSVKNCDLRSTSFEGTQDLRNIDFIDCKWPKTNRSPFQWVKSLRDKNCLFDEIFPNQGENDTEQSNSAERKPIEKDALSEMYRAVASSFESRHRYGSAGPFKVGEFEMRCKMKETPWTERAVLRLYKAASSYGESVWKPLFVLIFIVWIIPTIIYLFGGFPETASVDGGIKYKIINYNWGLPFSLLQTLLDLLKAFIFSLQALFAFGSDKLSQLTGYAQYFPVLQKIFGSIFTALFLFALRRKARR